MIWTIVILVAMNVSTFITLIYNRNREVKSVEGKEQAQTESTSANYSGRYFRDQLNLTGGQMEKFIEFNPVFRQNIRDINFKLDAVRQRMLKEMAAKTVDTARLDMLSDSVGILHSELKKVTYRYYLDIKDICDESQKQKLEQMFGQVFASDGRMGQYGRGRPEGRGRGRRFNNQ